MFGGGGGGAGGRREIPEASLLGSNISYFIWRV